MSDKPMLAERIAIVTGAGQGVGQGVARAFAAAGATVVVAQRNEELGEAEAAFLRDTHGTQAVFRKTDVTDRADVEAMIAETAERFGQLDILCNNAGATFAKRLENHDDDDMERLFAVNYWAVFWAMRAAFPIMKAQGYGRIINMGTLNGVNAHMFTAAYNASKEAMRALTRTAAVEWGPFGIAAFVICPAAVSPAGLAYFDANPDMKSTLLNQIPAGRFGDPEKDIGSIAAFLASEGSGYVTGNTVFASGGSHINGVSWRPYVED